MRRWPIAIALLATAGLRAAAEDAPAPASGLTLPVVTAAEPTPDAAGSATVTLRRDGQVWAQGARCRTLEQLRIILAARAGEVGREPDGMAAMDLVVAADQDVPFQAVLWMLQTAADPTVKASRIRFAVSHRASGKAGVLAFPLPRDRGIGGVVLSAPAPKAALRLFAERTGEPVAPERLYATLMAIEPELRADLRVEISCPSAVAGYVSHGYAVSLIDVLRAARVRHVTLVGDPSGPKRGEDLGVAIGRLLLRPAGVARCAWTGFGAPLSEAPLAIPDGPAAIPPEPGRAPASDAPGFVDPTDDPVDELHPSDGPGGEAPSKPRAGATAPAPPAGPAPALPPAGPPIDDPVGAGLAWLASHQSADGGWEAQGFGRWCDGQAVEGKQSEGPGRPTYDVGVTGLALLALLGAGHTSRSGAPFGPVVERGLRHLENVQDADGCFGARISSHAVYDHAIATLAMVEAYGAAYASAYRAPAQKALDFIATARNPYWAWRYGVKPGDNDTSVTVWMLMALAAARKVNEASVGVWTAPPLHLDESCFAGAREWIDRMTDPEFGRVGYQQRGSGPARSPDRLDRFPPQRSESMTAAGILGRLLLGDDPGTSDPIRKGVALCSTLLPRWDATDGSIDMYYWHHATLAMSRIGGDAWNAWAAALVPAVVGAQRRDGDACGARGSWDPIDPWGSDGGRVYATALMLRCLEVARGGSPSSGPPQPKGSR